MTTTGSTTRCDRIANQLGSLVRATSDPAAHRATAVALLHRTLSDVSWTGYEQVVRVLERAMAT